MYKGHCLTVTTSPAPPPAPAFELWVKHLADGVSHAALLLNTGADASDLTVNFADVEGLTTTEPVVVQDVWSGKIMGNFTGQYTSKNVPTHAVTLLLLKAATA